MKTFTARAASSRVLLSVATAATFLAAIAAPVTGGAAPVDDLRAAVAAGGNSAVADAKPKVFLTALSAVLAGVPAGQVPAYAAAAATLRPDLADAIVHAAVSALHLPGQLPDPVLVGAVVKAVVAAAPETALAVGARAVADAPEARDQVVRALAAAAPAQAPLFAKASLPPAGIEAAGIGSLPSSQVRPSDSAPSAAAVTSAATSGALNPANVSSPRRKQPPVSGF